MTAQVSDNHIRFVAETFRAAIEQADRSRLPITFRDFPAGSCGDAAILLGTYLIESDFGKYEYVLGERGRAIENSWRSHAWIENGDLTVDITADQFPDAPCAVIVERNSKWHRQFNGKVKNEAHFRVYDPHTANTLGNAYGEVVQFMTGAN